MSDPNKALTKEEQLDILNAFLTVSLEKARSRKPSANAQLNTLKYSVTDLFRPIPEAEKAEWRSAVQALNGQGPMKLDEMFKAVVAKDKQMKEIEDEAPQAQPQA